MAGAYRALAARLRRPPVGRHAYRGRWSARPGPFESMGRHPRGATARSACCSGTAQKPPQQHLNATGAWDRRHGSPRRLASSADTSDHVSLSARSRFPAQTPLAQEDLRSWASNRVGQHPPRQRSRRRHNGQSSSTTWNVKEWFRSLVHESRRRPTGARGQGTAREPSSTPSARTTQGNNLTKFASN